MWKILPILFIFALYIVQLSNAQTDRSLKAKTKWVWKDDPSHFILKKEKTNVWTEHKKNRPVAEYRVVPMRGSSKDLILDNKDKNIYMKIEDKRIIFSFNGIEGLKDEDVVVYGSWEKTKEKISRIKNPNACGIPSIKPLTEDGDKIIGGVEAIKSSWPWQVLLVIEFNGFPHKCGGSLITNEWIVTAAHCFFGDEETTVYMGIHDQTNRTDEDAIIASRVIIHPEYNREQHKNDIALVQLSKPAKFSERVRHICVPSINLAVVNKRVTVTGWGLTEAGFTSDVLMQVTLPVQTESFCDELDVVPDGTTQICGGDANLLDPKDACLGDSGGPLVVTNPDNSDQYVLAGVVSYGSNPCTGRGVYTNVAYYLNWIANELGVDLKSISS